MHLKAQVQNHVKQKPIHLPNPAASATLTLFSATKNKQAWKCWLHQRMLDFNTLFSLENPVLFALK